MRIGVFGGTFDPPHLGHVTLAAEAVDQLNLDFLLWVLTSDPPHKRSQLVSTVEQRLKMVQAVVSQNDRFELSRVDIDRPGPHYAADTVQLLAAQYPGCELVYLLGGDSLHDLPRWGRPVEFIRGCSEIAVMRRPGDNLNVDELEKTLPGLKSRVRILHVPLLEISSQQIRERIAAGRTYRYYLLSGVEAIIRQEKLYHHNPTPTSITNEK